MKTQQRYYRGHMDQIRAVLRFLEDARTPQATLRIMYIARTKPDLVYRLVRELEDKGLVKVYVTEYENSGMLRRRITITQKGKKVLQLLDELATLIPNAPWSVENTE